MSVTISLGQMDVKLGEVAANLATVRRLAAEAGLRGSQVLVLPELWSTGYDLDNAQEHASAVDAGIFAEVSLLAREHRLYILGSALSRLGAGEVGNTAVLFGPQGERLAAYSKIHLFRLMEEEQHLTAGNTLTLAQGPWGVAGLAICYDLRFPELFRAYALAGAGVIFLPAEWPHPRLAHWYTLLRARAVENQLYVVACNRVGRAKDTDFFGHSCIVDPWGETVIEGGEGELLLTATIEPARVAAVREQIPVFQDRRPQIYDKEIGE